MIKNSSYFVNVWVTLRCNFRCRYCYVKPYYRNCDMDIFTADKLIIFIKNNISKDQELILNFHGGEPLLNIEIIKYIVNKLKRELMNPVKFGVTTNGSLLDDEIIEYLGKTFSYNLSVSIDGKKETHDYNRKCIDSIVTYDTLLDNALKLLYVNRETRIRMTFDKYTVNALAENVKFFFDKGFHYIVPVADIFATDWEEKDFRKLKKELEQIKIYSIEKNVPMYIVNDEFEYLSPCNAGRDYYSVDPDGNIYPCTFLVGRTEMIIGNCYMGFNENKLEKIKKVMENKITECEECDMYRKCISTRCLFTNYVTTGDYYKPNLIQCNMLNIKYDLSESIINHHSYVRKEL